MLKRFVKAPEFFLLTGIAVMVTALTVIVPATTPEGQAGQPATTISADSALVKRASR